MENEPNRRRRRIVAALIALVMIAGVGAWTSWRSSQFRDQATRLNVGMTEAEVVAILGLPDAGWNAFPPFRVIAYGKGTKLRHAANNFRLDVTGNAQLHAGKADWPVQLKLDENGQVVGIERFGKTTGRSMGLRVIGVKGTPVVPPR